MPFNTFSKLSLLLTLTSLLEPVVSAPTTTKRDTSPIYDGTLVSGKTYDYVIAGGGLAGSVLAARLTEDAGRTVLVIESGYNEETRAAVYDASQYGNTFGTFLDWQYQTAPQSSADNKAQTIRAGRALGGSTAINGLAWSKPHKFQINAMEAVGNAGLNWNSLQTYMLRAENFQAPGSSQAANGLTYEAACHATSGPINTQYDPSAAPNVLESAFNTTVKDLGLPYSTDLTCGSPAGAAPIMNTRSGNTRIDAYRGYLYQKNIPNLTIISGANVGRVLLSSANPPVATGVEFQDENGNTYTVNANLEVIMATGSIKTPVILQQSGIGPTSVLNSAGVTQIVNLPVGQNLIDQTTTTTDWSFNAPRGGGQVINFPRFQDLVTGTDAQNLANMLNNDLSTYAQDAVTAGAFSNATALLQVLQIQRDWILNEGAGISESFDYSFGTTLGYDSWYLLPFGRGSVQINNNQPYSGSYTIDPRYFSNPFDRLAQGATARFTRTVSTSQPLEGYVTGESVPGGVLGPGSSLNQWAAWASSNYRSNWHPIGTAAMMSQNMGGCVDSRNRVYGVSKLRVVDGSTLPFQVSSHLMSVLYGLAERASDLIKADNADITGRSPSPSGSAGATGAQPTGSQGAQPTGTGYAGVAIHPNGDKSKCLDVVAANFVNGAAVDIYDCNGTKAQKFSFNVGTGSIKVTGTNYCLDAGSNPASGVKMKIWTCYPGLAAQTWNFGAGVFSLSTAGQCLDLTGGSKANGNVVQTWKCEAGNDNQYWTL